jgi:hypothetical protein
MVSLAKENYTTYYIYNLTDPSTVGAVLTSDIDHNLNMYYYERPLPKRFVPVPISKSYYAVGFSFPNLWNERLLEIVEALITGGIVNYHLEKYTKSKWSEMSNQLDSERVVLNLSHLGFGFQICFFALYAAFLVFCLEIVVKWCNGSKKVIESSSKRRLRLKEFEKSMTTIQMIITELILKHQPENVRIMSSISERAFGEAVNDDRPENEDQVESITKTALETIVITDLSDVEYE